MARRGGDHGANIDEFTVRGKRGGGTYGAGELLIWGKMEESGKEEVKGEAEGDMVCSRPRRSG